MITRKNDKILLLQLLFNFIGKHIEQTTFISSTFMCKSQYALSDFRTQLYHLLFYLNRKYV